MFLILCLHILLFFHESDAGYRAESLDIVLKAIKSEFNFTFQGLKMLEFGNQHFHGYESTNKILLDLIFQKYGYEYHHQNSSAKYFFLNLGFHHTSIDYNGLDGALALDARADLTEHLIEKYDVITNIGFSEHIGERDFEEELLSHQYAIFKNFHNLGKEGSLYIHVNPYRANWFRHGICDYSLDFFRTLVDLNNYSLKFLFLSDELVGYFGGGLQVVSVYQKPHTDPFITFEKFQALPGLTSIYGDYKILTFWAHFPASTTALQIEMDLSQQTPTQKAIEICKDHLLGDVSSCAEQISSFIHSEIKGFPPTQYGSREQQ